MTTLSPRRVKRQPEASLTDKIRAALNALDGVRVWRNNVGVATHTKEAGIYKMRYGLGVGSPDLVGILSQRYFEDAADAMRGVGVGVGRFLGVEVKRPGEKQSPEQHEWHDMIQTMGGIYIVATSAEEAVRLVTEAR